MYKGIYIALSGATLKQTQIDVISQNLANANTPGFKKDRVSFQDFLVSQLHGLPEPSDGRTMSDLSVMSTDFSNGVLLKTGNSLDVALEGRGFIGLEDGRYTRRGDFRLNSEGFLVTQEGLKVLGSGGPIQIPSSGKVEIGPSGDISVDGNAVGRIRIVDFPEISTLSKAGEDLFRSDMQGAEARPEVRQGYIETSNVEAVKEMVTMITALREFELFQKAIRAFDESAAKVINEMGRL